MTALQICAASLDSGLPMVLLSARHPAGPILTAAGLLVLERSGRTLLRPGHASGPLVALPPEAPLVAVLAEDSASAAMLAADLPPGLARLGAGDPRPALFSLLAARMAQEVLRHRATEHARLAALRLLGRQSAGQATLALPDGALAAARLTGAQGRLVAAGAEAPRMMLELSPGASAEYLMPPISCIAADLAIATLICRGGDATGLQVALLAGAPDSAMPHRGPPQAPDEDGQVNLALPLPATAGGVIRLALQLHHAGGTPLTLEITRIGLTPSAKGEPFAPGYATAWPPLPTPPLPMPPEAGPTTVALPPDPITAPQMQSVALPEPLSSFRSVAPQPPLAVTAPPEAAPSPPRASFASVDSGSTAFQDLRLHQHMVSPDGGYQHLEVTLTGLVSTAGLWRQVRFKLFDRRGTIGLEVRELKGWPQMFDVWPPGRSDKFGPFWRLETTDTQASLEQLATPHDRALVRALMEILPSVAPRAASTAGLEPVEQDGWADRARRLAQAGYVGLAGTTPGGPPGG